MTDTCETITIYRSGEPVLINKSDLKDTDKLKPETKTVKPAKPAKS